MYCHLKHLTPYNLYLKISETQRLANKVDTIDLDDKIEEILHPDNEFRKKNLFLNKPIKT